MGNKETMPSPVSPEVRGSEYKPEPTTWRKVGHAKQRYKRPRMRKDRNRTFAQSHERVE